MLLSGRPGKLQLHDLRMHWGFSWSGLQASVCSMRDDDRPGEPLVGDRTRCCCQEEAWPLMCARRSAPRRAMSSTGSRLSSGWNMSRLGWSLSSISCVASRFT